MCLSFNILSHIKACDGTRIWNCLIFRYLTNFFPSFWLSNNFFSNNNISLRYFHLSTFNLPTYLYFCRIQFQRKIKSQIEVFSLKCVDCFPSSFSFTPPLCIWAWVWRAVRQVRSTVCVRELFCMWYVCLRLCVLVCMHIGGMKVCLWVCVWPCLLVSFRLCVHMFARVSQSGCLLLLSFHPIKSGEKEEEA